MEQQKIFLKIGNCDIHPTAHICNGAVIGKPYRKLLNGNEDEDIGAIIEEDAYIGYYTIVGGGSVIKSGSIIDDHCIIESRVTIGKCSLIIYNAQICNDAQIGNNCVVGGLIAERSRIGNNCRIFGNIVHLQHNPCLGWDDEQSIEDSLVIHDYVFVGFGAVVSGGITIDKKVYICSNAIITKNIPEYHIAYGINKMVHCSQWKGRLSSSPFFSNNNE